MGLGRGDERTPDAEEDEAADGDELYVRGRVLGLHRARQVVRDLLHSRQISSTE